MSGPAPPFVTDQDRDAWLHSTTLHRSKMVALLCLAGVVEVKFDATSVSYLVCK
jgi:hypothetical protein